LNNDNHQVAVFIDYDNIEISYESHKHDKTAEVEWSRILEEAAQIGRVVYRRAYADWSIYPDRQRELLGLGIDLIHVSSRRGKNAADIRIVIDALELLHSNTANLTHVLLVSGDGDFTELVHRLRRSGLTVIGMGISGTTAEYLVNACDEFMFYDRLVNSESTPAKGDPASETVSVSFELSEARQLMRRVLQTRESDWMLAAELKNAMLRLDPAFNERNYGYSSFKDFLNAQKDMVQVKSQENQISVMLIFKPAEKNGSQAPEALLDKYLELLAKDKIRMTPNEYRPRIIFKFFELCRAHPEYSLTQLKEQVHAYFEETAPLVKWQYIHETAHQLFHTYCFDFDKSAQDDVRLWDRRVSLAEGIKRRDDMLDKCDRSLLQKLAKPLGGIDKVDQGVAARLLYGSVKGQKMLEHIKQLVESLK